MCYTTCLPRFFPNTSTLVCDNCPYDCYTCDSKGNCLTCNGTTDFRVLLVNTTAQTSRCVPMNGYFEIFTQTASFCPVSCSLCLNLTYCTSCNNGFYLRADNQCYSTCLERYYADSSSNTCKNCLYDCYTCNNNNGCLSCSATIDFRVLNNTSQRCVPINSYYDNKT